LLHELRTTARYKINSEKKAKVVADLVEKMNSNKDIKIADVEKKEARLGCKKRS
jgi:hypothetical protein